MLRVTILSLDQIQLWNMSLILIVFLFFFSFRYFIPESEPGREAQKNHYQWEIDHWESALEGVAKGDSFAKKSREQMASLLVSHEEAETGGGTAFIILDEYRKGERELPFEIHSFLFEKQIPVRGIRKWFSPSERRGQERQEASGSGILVFFGKGNREL